MSGTDPEVFRRISMLERQVNALIRHTDMPPPEPDADLSAETKAAIAGGMSAMDAVKLIRGELGCDLTEAQRVYESAF